MQRLHRLHVQDRHQARLWKEYAQQQLQSLQMSLPLVQQRTDFQPVQVLRPPAFPHQGETIRVQVRLWNELLTAWKLQQARRAGPHESPKVRVPHLPQEIRQKV